MTWVAVMVVLLVVPSTRTGLPVVTALAVAERAPSSYVVLDDFLIVTFSPADVVTVKPDVDTLLSVPNTPPAAGPHRSLVPRFAANLAFTVCPVLAPAEPSLEVALTIP